MYGACEESWDEYAFHSHGLPINCGCQCGNGADIPDGLGGRSVSLSPNCMHMHGMKQASCSSALEESVEGLKGLLINMYSCSRREILKCGGIANRVWSSSELLGRFLFHNQLNFQRDIDVLELGCGLGLAGIVAHQLGIGKVTLTDFNRQALKWTQKCIDANKALSSTGGAGTRITCSALDWSVLPDDMFGKFDLILAADTIHESEHPKPFSRAVAHCMRKDGVCILINPVEAHRYGMDELVGELEDAGLSCRRYSVPRWLHGGIEEDSMQHDLYLVTHFDKK